MKNLQWWSEMFVGLTRGAAPVDGIMLPPGSDEDDRQAAMQVSPPREAPNSETEYDVGVFPKWGNFR